MISYVTSSGIRIEISRIHRRYIDRFILDHPAPDPPMRQAEAFGGVDEDIPVWDDPVYLSEMQTYYLQLSREEIGLLLEAIRVPDTCMEELHALVEYAIAPDTSRESLIDYVILADDSDRAAVTEQLLYISTVTQKGIQEAADRFGVIWQGTPVLQFKPKNARGSYGWLYDHRLAARFSYYTWEEFCELPGPEQSALVAFRYCFERVEALKEDERGKR